MLRQCKILVKLAMVLCCKMVLLQRVVGVNSFAQCWFVALRLFTGCFAFSKICCNLRNVHGNWKGANGFLPIGGRGALVLLATVDILTWLWYYVIVEICACKIAIQPIWLQSTCSVAFFAYVVASLHHNCAMQQLQTALFACAVCYHAYAFLQTQAKQRIFPWEIL